MMVHLELMKDEEDDGRGEGWKIDGGEILWTWKLGRGSRGRGSRW